MKPKIYIETTIPSFYYEIRKEPEMVARRNWTREWWDNHIRYYEPVTSEAVFDELSRGNYPNKDEKLSLIDKLPVLSIESEISEIVDVYIQHKLMPADPLGDALHLAIASFYRCDFLLTWNCTHLANANKYSHIRRINAILDVFSPLLITPLELVGAYKDEKRSCD